MFEKTDIFTIYTLDMLFKSQAVETLGLNIAIIYIYIAPSMWQNVPKWHRGHYQIVVDAEVCEEML